MKRIHLLIKLHWKKTDADCLFRNNVPKLSDQEIVKKAIAMRGENPNLVITLSGDTNANYGAVMHMMGKLKDANFQRVGLRTNPNNK